MSAHLAFYSEWMHGVFGPSIAPPWCLLHGPCDWLPNRRRPHAHATSLPSSVHPLSPAEAGSPVSLQVNKLWSARTQLTYSYYSLPFCKPDAVVEERENLGQILVGDRIMSSDYKLALGADSRCNFLCSKSYTPEETAAFTERIDNEYTVNWILDGLPGE